MLQTTLALVPDRVYLRYMQLRHYQIKAVEEIRKYYRQGVRKVLLHLATGGGKTATFCDMVELAAANGKRCLVVVRGVKLIEQASERLTREGVKHGILQGQNSRDSFLPVLVCSIDTLYRRREVPDADFIVIDEAHHTGGAGYKWFIDQYPKAYFLPVSATPHLKQGMRHVADAVVYPISIAELISEGFLVSSRTFVGITPKLDGCKINSTGDFDEGELSQIMSTDTMAGDPVKQYRKLAHKKKALLFAVTIEHSKLLVDRFRADGYNIEHIDAKTPQKERNRIINLLRDGHIDIISNVGVLHTGFDLPALECIIIARPTMSYNLHIQILGRGTRPYPGKSHFLVLDCAGNTKRHGFIEDEEICDLEGSKPRQVSTVECQFCKFIYSIKKENCPECGATNEYYVPPEVREAEARRQAEIADVEMVELKKSLMVEAEMTKLIEKAKKKGYKKGWIYMRLADLFGQEVAKKLWESKIKRMKPWPLRDQPTPNSSGQSSTTSTNQGSASSGSTTPGSSERRMVGSSSLEWSDHQTLSGLLDRGSF